MESRSLDQAIWQRISGFLIILLTKMKTMLSIQIQFSKKKKKKNQNSIRIQFMKLQWVIHFWIQIIPLAYQKQTSGLAIKHYFLDLLLLRFIFTRAPSTSGMQIARDISTPFPEASECASPVGILCCSSRWIEFGT